MKFFFLVSMVSVFSVQCSEHMNSPSMYFYNQKEQTSFLFELATQIPGFTALATGILTISSLFGKESLEKPTKQWRPDHWHTFLHKKVKNSDDSYFNDAIKYYPGYLYPNFCLLVGNFDCDESYFDDLEKFVGPFGEYENTPLRHFFSSLPCWQQGAFWTGVRSVVALRNKNKQEAQQKQWQEYQEQERNQKITTCLREQKEISKKILQRYSQDQYEYVPQATMQERLKGLSAHAHGNYQITTRTYSLSSSVQTTLRSYNVVIQQYQKSIGSELQHILHAECITLVENIGNNSGKSLNALIMEFLDLGRTGNQACFIEPTLELLNVCWSLLACSSKAVICGSVRAAQEMGNMVADFVADPYKALEDFGKTIGQVVDCLMQFIANHPPVALIMAERAHGNFQHQTVVEELFNVSEALRLYIIDHPYQALEEASYLATQGFLTNHVAGIFFKFFTNAVKKVPEYVAQAFKVLEPLSHEQLCIAALAAEMEEVIGLSSLEYEAHNVVRYEKLKNALRIEEFTSITGLTKHGLQRLIERGFESQEVISILTKPSYIKTQSNGAKAFIQKVGEKYKIIIINSSKDVIAGMKDLSLKKNDKIGGKIWMVFAMNNLGFQCCFCNKKIQENQNDPCDINIMCNFGKVTEDRENQSFYCHYKCFQQRLHEEVRGYLIVGDDDE